tara:strand:+ start:412 stop:708 length:297 start_codon:yes stop_codon:yes gene_type:complete
MKVIILTLLLSLNSNFVFAGKNEMVKATINIPGIMDASWQGSLSFWIIMDDPSQEHPYDQYGSMICNGSVTNFSVPKGYVITFWNRWTNKPINKYKCY